MNVRVAMALVAVLVVIGAYVLVQGSGDEPPPVSAETYLYDVDERTISHVEMTHLGSTQRFFRDEDSRQWVFDDEQRYRWTGITVLLAGPRVKRLLPADETGVGRYGLEEPATVIRIRLDGGQAVTISLGILTPDAESHYAMREGSSRVALVDRSWGDVLMRLVTDPPY